MEGSLRIAFYAPVTITIQTMLSRSLVHGSSRLKGCETPDTYVLQEIYRLTARPECAAYL